MLKLTVIIPYNPTIPLLKTTFVRARQSEAPEMSISSRMAK